MHVGQGARVQKLVDGGVDRLVDRPQEMAPAEIVETPVEARDEAELGEILHRFDTKNLVLLAVGHAVLIETRRDSQDLAAFVIEGDDVRFFVIVFVEIEPSVALQCPERRVFVVERRGKPLHGVRDGTDIVRRDVGAFQILIEEKSGQYPFADIVRGQVQDVRLSDRCFERLGPVIHHQFPGQNMFRHIPSPDRIVPGLFEFGTGARQHDQQPVHVLFPFLHLFQHLIAHVPGNATRLRGFHAIRIETRGTGQHDFLAGNQGRVGARRELDAGRRQQWVFYVRGTLPRETLVLHDLGGEL